MTHNHDVAPRLGNLSENRVVINVLHLLQRLFGKVKAVQHQIRLDLHGQNLKKKYHLLDQTFLSEF